MLKRLFIVIFGFIFSILISSAQDDTVSIRIFSGGNVEFKINTIKNYKVGLEYIGWSTIKLNFINHPDATNNWALQFKANEVNIEGSTTNTLPLSTIKLYGTDGINSSAGYMDLTGGWQTLVSNSTTGESTITIDYKCITNDPDGFVNYLADIYYVNIIFQGVAQ